MDGVHFADNVGSLPHEFVGLGERRFPPLALAFQQSHKAVPLAGYSEVGSVPSAVAMGEGVELAR